MHALMNFLGLRTYVRVPTDLSGDIGARKKDDDRNQHLLQSFCELCLAIPTNPKSIFHINRGDTDRKIHKAVEEIFKLLRELQLDGDNLDTLIKHLVIFTKQDDRCGRFLARKLNVFREEAENIEIANIRRTLFNAVFWDLDPFMNT